MNKKTIILMLCWLTLSFYAMANEWGKTGHRVVGEIAQQHLTPKTNQRINELLGGMSLAFVSIYADEIRSDGRYDHLAPWHYVNMAAENNYHESDKNPDGDIVTAMGTCVNVLQNPNSTEKEKSFYLKLLVHFIGDAHQPLHAGRKQDKGGNEIQVFWFGEVVSLHALWDSNLIDHYQMSYTELAAHLPKISQEEKQRLMHTPRLDWIHESQALANTIYAQTPENASLGFVYHYQHFETVRQQLLAAGLRLAATLNMIFDPQ